MNLGVLSSHDPATGELVHRLDATGLALALAQDVSLVWDELGNLNARHDRAGMRDQHERFHYDARNRLIRTDHRENGGAWTNHRQTQSYDAAGNIQNKSDLGNYTYGSSKPHAVTNAGGVNYSYDANGKERDRGRTNVIHSNSLRLGQIRLENIA